MRTRHGLAALALTALTSVLAASPAAALDCTGSYPTQTQRYVCALYEDDALLGRIPSSREVAYWTDRVERFGRGPQVEAFVFSVEFMVEVVGDAYDDILGREADPSGINFWTDRLRARAITPEGLERLLADSGEFGAAHPDPGAVVDFWYDYVLGRAPDPDGRAFWINQLNAGLRRSALVASLQTSGEGAARTVSLLYSSVLERTAAANETSGWTPYLRQNGRALLLVALASSDEAFLSA